MAGTLIAPIVGEGLGNSAYLVDLASTPTLGPLTPARSARCRTRAGRPSGYARCPQHRARRAHRPGSPGGGGARRCHVGTGERAAIAASELERAGYTAVTVLSGGPSEWADATGLALESTA